MAGSGVGVPLGKREKVAHTYFRQAHTRVRACWGGGVLLFVTHKTITTMAVPPKINMTSEANRHFYAWHLKQIACGTVASLNVTETMLYGAWRKAKAQHSMLMANLNRQGIGKSSVILVGAMGTTKTIQRNLWHTVIWITIRFKTWHTNCMNTPSGNASALIKTRYEPQYYTSNNCQGLGPGATAHNPPDPH